MEKTLGQIACEAISGPKGWEGCASVPGLHAMWETAAQAAANTAVAADIEALRGLLTKAREVALWHVSDSDERGVLARHVLGGIDEALRSNAGDNRAAEGGRG